jgi:mono/diheme cytochrome c family protein
MEIAMLRSRSIRILIAVILIAAALIVVRVHVAGGQISDGRLGDAASGRRLVETWCAECHSIEPGMATAGKVPPDFSEIAQRPSTTALALRVFLQSGSKTMPHFIIGRGDTDDIVAYILGLRP